MDTPGSPKQQSRRITPRLILRMAIVLAILWTGFIAAFVRSNYRLEHNAARETARIAARAEFTKDLVYRRWNARLGGVYAEVTEHLQPNPYLAHMEQRDIVTTTGKKLTLINPAYMTRRVHELARESEGTWAHITSLDPIRPENAADEWETKALRSFDDPDDEIVEEQMLEGTLHLRLMKPLYTEESCLTCHAQQGYRVGDIRGGISVSVPMEKYLAIARNHSRATLSEYGFVWIMGLGGIGIGTGSLRSRARQQLDAEQRVESLLEERELMLREVQHRIKNNMSTMASLLHLKANAVKDQASRKVLREMSDRFGIMMVLYRKLYESSDPYALRLDEYLPEIIRELILTLSGTHRFDFRKDIEDIVLNPGTMSALGILTAEAVTNSIKHAFPEGAKGMIEVTARRRNGMIRYTVRDNGRGLPEQSPPVDGPGLGLKLIQALASQIGGDAVIGRTGGTGGTEITVTFPEDVPSAQERQG